MVVEEEELALTFADLLRQLRAEARLTQEELAEAAGLSPRSVSDLERGINRTARKDTAVLLAGALGLSGEVAESFVAAARGRGPAADVAAARKGAAAGTFAAAATRGLPRDVASFTGRRAELARLMEAIDASAAEAGVVGIHAIDGMAGIGKTTLAVHAAHRLAEAFPDGQLFLPLHAHTRGQRPVDPAHALASLLLIIGVPAAQIPLGLEARAARWRDHVAGKKILLLLDDAAGHDQIRPLLPGTGSSLVLVTSRRRLAALDAEVLTLDTLSPGEAAALLVRLAARPGMSAGDVAVREVTRLCGYLPLAIGMLASQLRHHPAWTAEGMVTELAQARDRLALMHAENVSVGAALDLSCQDLTPQQQRLFRYLGLIPGPDFDACAAAALDATSPDTARRDLDELYDQHLLAEPAPGRYQLHDLLREHARALAAAGNPAESDAAAGRLLDYYLHTALAAGRHFPRRVGADRRPPGSRGAQAPDLSTLAQAAAWLEAERANLHAAADYAATRGCNRHAIAIPAAISSFLAVRGHWDQSAAIQHGALAAARQAGDRAGEAEALAELGGVQQLRGEYPAAAVSLARALALFRDLGDRPGEAHALNQLGFVHVLTGDYPAAAASQQQALALARSASDRHGEAAALNHLGLVQQLTGNYPAAAASQQQALALFDDLGNLLGQAYACNDLGLLQQDTGDYAAAANNHQQALALFDDLGNLLGQAEALNRLGELSLRTSAPGQARDQHTRALAIARDISAAPEEARALEGIANTYLREGNSGQATADLLQALTIYQRLGAPAARRVQQTLEDHGLTSTPPQPGPAAPGSEGHQPRSPAAAPPESI